MKLRPHSVRWNGERLEKDEFAFVQVSHSPEPTEFVHFCPRKNRICQVKITKGKAEWPVWNWDGNEIEPTITPSIGCESRCGWHGNITNGERLP